MSWAEEDWTMQLAELGATEFSMHDLNVGAPDAIRQATELRLKKRKDVLTTAVTARPKIEATDSLKEKNRQALEALRQKRREMLPEGWRMVESRSKPGTYVYENVYTDERQAWLPTEPAVKLEPEAFAEPEVAAAPAAGGLTAEQKEKNKRALAARKASAQGFLPDGWRKVPSNSRPGQFVYENIYTEERVAWYPLSAASKKATPTQTLPAEKEAERVKAVYPYAAADTEEIDLDEGDIVVVEVKADNGWWVGTNERTGQLGLFPGGFTAPL
eukprot:m.17672 g.17672  ORF g.17672 m.17672 type:complete len:272 (+) comp7518_c0_seq2:284-1099(+)